MFHWSPHALKQSVSLAVGALVNTYFIRVTISYVWRQKSLLLKEPTTFVLEMENALPSVVYSWQGTDVISQILVFKVIHLLYNNCNGASL